MKRTVIELRKAFRIKIQTINRFLELVGRKGIPIEEKNEIVALIAVELRSLFCNSSERPLIINSQMEKELFFPMYDSMAPFNELSDFMLVGTQCDGNKSAFYSSLVLDGSKVPTTWLSYSSWINQIVIDLKVDKYPPLTRGNVIKIVADKNGAHLDPEIHSFVGLIETSNVLPFRIIVGEKECEADCSNLLHETICSIAKEAVFTYNYLPIVLPNKTTSSFELRVFDYSDEKNKRYKFSLCNPSVPLYETNRHYPCSISSFPVPTYDMLFRSKKFQIYLIRIEDYQLLHPNEENNTGTAGLSSRPKPKPRPDSA